MSTWRWLRVSQICAPWRGLPQPQSHGLHVTALQWGWGHEHVMRVELPDIDFRRRMESMEASPAEVRDFYKRSGLHPPSQEKEQPMYMASTGAYMDEFVVPEGDGRASILSKQGAKDSALTVQKKGKTLLATRKIRKYDDDFDAGRFPEDALDIYTKAHEALANKNDEELQKYATEKAYPEMLFNTETKTIMWKFIKSLEPGRVVHVRATDAYTKENVFAQVTVRYHTQQILAVYDRFGRLISGSPTVAKDVLEYVVFEKHVANTYGKWRIHGKIIPDWMEPKQPGLVTRVILPEPEEVAELPAAEVAENREDDASEEDAVYDKFNRAK
eukprot:maker-scaffold42_size484952-snap-gene-3.27 protein:Tk06373 transcript:maker-scaffold42_size484952-snap-gene-3.27-mRNA-1 annotation:"probable 39s ribosomal protein mitochondrial precursor"